MVFAILRFKDYTLPALHLFHPFRTVAMLPPAFCPFFIEIGGLVPGSGVRSDYIRGVYPCFPAEYMWKFLETCFKPGEFFIAIRIETQAVSRILEFGIVRTEIQPLGVVPPCKAV